MVRFRRFAQNLYRAQNRFDLVSSCKISNYPTITSQKNKQITQSEYAGLKKIDKNFNQ